MATEPKTLEDVKTRFFWLACLLAIGAIVLAVSSHTAEARTRHHHHRHHVHRTHSRIVHQPVAQPPSFFSSFMSEGSSLVSAAKVHLGATAAQLGLPRRLWCADFMNQTLRRAGYQGTGSRQAKSFLANPRTTAHVGAIAVLSRRGGGHVGIVSGFDERGNPVIVSGNHRHEVGESVYASRRVLAYVEPQ